LQLNYDLAQARQHPQPAVRAIGPVLTHA
jgi:hypothetical protein